MWPCKGRVRYSTEYPKHGCCRLDLDGIIGPTLGQRTQVDQDSIVYAYYGCQGGSSDGCSRFVPPQDCWSVLRSGSYLGNSDFVSGLWFCAWR